MLFIFDEPLIRNAILSLKIAFVWIDAKVDLCDIINSRGLPKF